MTLKDFDWDEYEKRRARRIADNSKYFESARARLDNDSVANLNAGITKMIKRKTFTQIEWVEQLGENNG